MAHLKKRRCIPTNPNQSLGGYSGSYKYAKTFIRYIRSLIIVLCVIMFWKPINVQADWKFYAKPLPFDDDKVHMTDDQGSIVATKTTNEEDAMVRTKAAGTGCLMSATEETPEITELARALQHDPKLIFDFVRNHIEYIPTRGCNNGATGTLYAKRGNGCDQTALFLALVRASGYTDSFFVNGAVNYMVTDAAAWLGVTADKEVVENIFKLGGIRVLETTNPNVLRILRFWAKVNIDGTYYYFDPAYKTYDTVQGLSRTELEAAMGYNQSDFLNTAGGTFQDNWVQNMDENAIRSELATLSTNMVNYLRADHPNASVDEILGCRKIHQEKMEAYSTSLPAGSSASEWSVYADLPESQCVLLRIAHRGIYINLKGWEISGKRVTISYTGADYAPELKVDGEVIETGNSCTLGRSYTLKLSVYHPYYAVDENGESWGGYCDEVNREFSLKCGANYNISFDFGNVSADLIQARSEKLSLAKIADDETLMLEETLHIMGLNWMHESLLLENISMKLSDLFLIRHHYIGLMAQEYGISGGGYYIDVPMAISSFGKKDGDPSSTDGFGNTRATTTVMSAFEHGILEQSQDGDQFPAMSTVKILAKNNADGYKTYFMEDTFPCVFGLLYYEIHPSDPFLGPFYVDPAIPDVFSLPHPVPWPQLECPGTLPDLPDGCYYCEKPELTKLKDLISNGYKLIIPENTYTKIAADSDWSGLGYVRTKTVEGGISVGMIISGGYNGGYGAYTAPIDLDYAWNYFDDYWNDPFGDFGTKKYDMSYGWWDNFDSNPVSRDPVDMITGDFLHNNVDLTLGGEEPMGLRFSRSYNSGSKHDYLDKPEKRPLGYGWTHNYNIWLEEHSHTDPAFAERTPVDAASAITGMYVCFDIMKDQDNLKGWMTSILAAKWLIDQIINNAATVHLGGKTMEYIKLSDGTYNAPPGVTTRLVNEGGVFKLKKRFDSTLEFNEKNQISSWYDADGNTMTFTYDTSDRLWFVEDAFGRILFFSYIDSSVWVGDLSRWVQFILNSKNELETFIDAEGKTWEYGYDPNGTHRMVSITDPLGITTVTNTYNPLGRVASQTVPRQGETTTYNLYFSGFRNIEEDALGNQTIYYFDKKQRNIAIENALGHKSRQVFDGQDHVISSIDPRMNVTTNVYDGDHNLVKTMGPLFGTEYDSEFDYDSQFRKTDAYLSMNDVRIRHVSHTDYDAEHHPTMATTYPETGEEIHNSSTYYPNGLMHTSTDGRGITSQTTYDSYGNVNTSQVEQEPYVDYDYNEIGQLVSLTDQAGAVTSFTYDNRGLIKTKTDPLGKTSLYNYYDDGRLHSITDRNNDVTTYLYTPSGKIETIIYQDGTTINFQYDIRDNLQSIHDCFGTTLFYPYDEANQLKGVVDPQGFALAYEYDEAGNITEITYPGNKKMIYTYDALNRLDTIIIDWLGKTAEYNYDASGRLETLENFNGIQTSFEYDNADRLTGLQNTKSDLTPICTYHFEMDGNGNRTFIVTSEPLAPVMNPSTTTYTYNTSRNRLVAAGGSYFTYDDEGQLSYKDSTPFTFDYEHRLTAIGSDYAYFYDGMGKRLKAVRNGVETRYIYDQSGNLLAEADENNNITCYYIYGKGLLAMVTASGEIYCYHFDAIGSTIAMTDSGQDIVNSYAYTPFGIIANQSEAVPQPFKYVGQSGVMTEPNGLYYMRARYYDPSVGRFISEDPAGFEGGGPNLYVYCNNNPVLLVDPTGEFFNFGLAAIGAGVGAVTGGLSSVYGGDSFWKGALIGGTIGATAGFTCGGSLLAQAAIGASIGGGANIATQVVTNVQAGRDAFDIDPSDVFISTLAGGVGGFVGGSMLKGGASKAFSTYGASMASGGTSMYLNYSSGIANASVRNNYYGSSGYAGGTYK